MEKFGLGVNKKYFLSLYNYHFIKVLEDLIGDLIAAVLVMIIKKLFQRQRE